MLAALKERDFALLWAAGLVSYLGNWAMLIALPFFVYQRTSSTFAASAVLSVILGPLVFSTLAGVLVDRWDRRRTLVAANVVMAGLSVPALVSAAGGPLWIVFAAVLSVSVAGLVVAPAENALLPRLVAADHLVAANSLNALNDNIARIVGPALGGALVAGVGFGGVVVFNAVSFAVAAGLTALIRSSGRSGRTVDGSAPADGGVRQVWRDWQDGLTLIGRSRLLRALFVVAATAQLGDALFFALLAPFVVDLLVSGAGTLGAISALRGIGGITGGLVAPFISKRWPPGAIIGVSIGVCGCLLAVITASRSVPLVLGVAFAFGVLAVCWLANQQALVQTSAADRFLGRVFGAFGTAAAATGLVGSLIGGLLADYVGIPALMYSSAALYAAAGVVGLTTLRTHQAGRQGEGR